MNFASRVIKYLNSTPSVFLKPTGVVAFDVALSVANLAIWSWIARRSKMLREWYRSDLDVPVPANPNCGHDEVLPTLMSNGVAIVNSFLNPDAFSAVLQATASDFLTQSGPNAYYGTGVLAHYSKLPPELVSHFDAYIRKIFFSIWGFPYNGNISASIQHLRLPADKKDENDPNTILHVDRFLPSVKVFYYPYEVKDDEAPFGYVPGSHRISDHYTDAVKKSFRTLHRERNKPFELRSYSGQREEWRLSVPANTLVIAAVHGLHRRTPFSEFLSSERSRTSVRFVFYDQVNKTRLVRSALLGS
jgi:hypothetical protein